MTAQAVTPYAVSERTEGAPPRHVSFTQIATYLACPLKYRLRYVDGIEAPVSPAAAVGRVVHAAIREVHRRRWADRDMDDVAELVERLWEEQSEDIRADEKAARDVQAARDEWLPWYLHWIEGQTDIVVEERWELELPGVDIPLVGYHDRVYRADGQTIISDIKTGRTKPSPKDLATDLQLSIYSWAFRRLSPKHHDDALEIVHLRSRTVLRTSRTDEYLDHVIADVVVPTVRAIEAGLFPANPGTRFGCAYCEFEQLCPIGRGGEAA